jgi:hypothetical protein
MTVKIGVVSKSAIAASGRLDAEFHLNPGGVQREKAERLREKAGRYREQAAGLVEAAERLEAEAVAEVALRDRCASSQKGVE